jgi:polysaccharide deacetylase 2 family uncharacterized protein YibQ
MRGAYTAIINVFLGLLIKLLKLELSFVSFPKLQIMAVSYPFFVLFLLLFASFSKANDNPFSADLSVSSDVAVKPYAEGKLVILIDDMGNSLRLNNAALNLPGPISFAFLPFAHYSKKLAYKAQQLNKDILLHAPMETIHNIPLGKGGVTATMNEAEFKQVLHQNIDAIPHLIGVNNHMGSKLTALDMQMRWTMEVVKERGLFFLDSKTTGRSVAGHQAKKAGMLGLQRDIFLDHQLNINALHKQYDKALSIAKKHGYCVVIAHPHSMTISFLQEKLRSLDKQNVELVSISALIDFKRNKLAALQLPDQQEQQVFEVN